MKHKLLYERQLYENVDKSLLKDKSLFMLKLYFEDNLTQKAIAERLNQSLYKTSNEISKAIFELKKTSNDPEYLKMRAIYDRRK
jgi:DNA-directed RNA polymerase specialized sigma subunit